MTDASNNASDKTEKNVIFKNGDLAMLKSGGPEMTVANDKDGVETTCVWFHENTLYRVTFEDWTLRKIS